MLNGIEGNISHLGTNILTLTLHRAIFSPFGAISVIFAHNPSHYFLYMFKVRLSVRP